MRFLRRRIRLPDGPRPAVLRVKDGDMLLLERDRFNDAAMEDLLAWLERTDRSNVIVVTT